MGTLALPIPAQRFRCYYRPLLLAAGGLILLGIFWFTSRYPSLLSKASHLGQELPTMAYSKEVLPLAAGAPVWQQILYGAVNWLAGMKIGMTFGVLFGALLHTYLRYYPLKIGRNLYLNSMKGALVGVPMGVCANCAVPTACGVTRGRGRVEVALGFLFSSPNFNPVVMVMTFTALPLAMSVTKYAILLAVIVLVVPALVQWLERDRPFEMLTIDDSGSCAVPLGSTECRETFGAVASEVGRDFARNAWMLVKPTVTIMVLASLVAATMLVLIPWHDLLAEVTPWRVALVSVIAVLMPVPIALDVMFAALLLTQGVSTGYVMLFAMTLGTYSVIPSIYLWRDVSRPLSLLLFGFFVVVGLITGLVF